MTIKARAKINTVLEILHKRADGYHEIRTVMQSLKLCDTINIKKTSICPFLLETNDKNLQVSGQNIIEKTAGYLIETYKIDTGIHIYLDKKIPITAGLGGGSADCAATIIGINKLFGLQLSKQELLHIGRIFGADVPFCLTGGTVYACGAGEKLTELPPHPKAYVLLTGLGGKTSTKEIYNLYDSYKEGEKNNKQNHTQPMISAIKSQDIGDVANSLYNAFLPVMAAINPDVPYVINTMKEMGAMGASMTGAGPSVFGFFNERDKAKRCKKKLASLYPQTTGLFLTEIYN